MKNKLFCGLLALIITFVCSGCDSMFIEEAPPAPSSSLPSGTVNYESYVDNFSSQQTAGQYKSDLPYAFCVDEKQFDIKNVVYFQILDFDKANNTFVYAFQAPLISDKSKLVTRLMKYRFDTDGSYGTPDSDEEYKTRIKNGQVFFQAITNTKNDTIEVLSNDDSATKLGSTVTISGESSMYAAKLPYSNGYFLYVGGTARYFNAADMKCYKTVDLGNYYNMAYKRTEAKNHMISDVKPMYIDGIESIVITSTFNDYSNSDDMSNAEEDEVSKKTHGVVFVYQLVNMSGKYFHKKWYPDEDKNSARLYTSSISLKGYGTFDDKKLYSNDSPLTVLGGIGSRLPSYCNIRDPNDARSLDGKLIIDGEISNISQKTHYKTIKNDKGDSITVVDYYTEDYYLAGNSYLLLCNYFYNCNLVLNSINNTELLCFDNENAYWLSDKGNITANWAYNYRENDNGRLKQNALLSSSIFSKKYTDGDSDDEKSEVIQAAGELKNGFSLFSSRKIYLTKFSSINNIGYMYLNGIEEIDLKKLNFSEYKVDMQASSNASSINYNWQSSHSQYQTDVSGYLSSESDNTNTTDPNAEAPNPDTFTGDSMMYLDDHSYLFTGLSNGVLRYNSDTHKAEQVLKAAIYRAWKISDKNYMAVGFNTGKQRYTISDFPRARIINFKI